MLGHALRHLGRSFVDNGSVLGYDAPAQGEDRYQDDGSREIADSF
jgi:hypothetical protein